MNPDAGDARGVRVVVEDPPGQSIGLVFGESETLRVRYEFEDGEPIPGARVEFAIVESPTTDPGGSTLTATSAMTGADGVARVDLTAGVERATFRVSATAPEAAPAYFYVSVSELGFAQLEVMANHAGERDPASFSAVELRLYQAETVECTELDIDNPPVSAFQPLSMAGFTGETRTYENVSVGSAYTLVGWAQLPGNSVHIAAGCVDLTVDLITTGTRRIELAVRDRPLNLPSSVVLASTVDLAPLADELATSPAGAPWRTLACGAGPGQLLLECTVDALEPDGTLDCVVNANTVTVASIEAQRGEPTSDGCRPDEVVSGTDSLDRELADAVAAGGTFPTGTDLDALLDARTDALSELELGSVLKIQSAAALSHHLGDATLSVAGVDQTTDLGATARPIVWQGGIGYQVETDTMTIAPHGFTLRLGSLARAAFRDVGLAGAGIDDREADLGTALAESASDPGAGTTGCQAVSSILCSRIGQADSCAVTACQTATAELDNLMMLWWMHLDGAALDFALGGDVPLVDENDDLWVDGLGTGSTADPGIWAATFTTRDDTLVEADGSFASTMVIGGP